MARKKSKAGMARRFAAAALAGCMLYCGGVQANAATLKDVFDEHYYADTNPDLKEAFGYNREALWQHFMRYGINEGRNMNGLIDIVKYREKYSDLNAAFGNNWNAYLNHYLTFGAKENRDTGTDFNALDYAGRYEDLQAAYGTNVLALWNHYRAFGATEGREARDESIVQAEAEAAAREAEEAEESQARPEREDIYNNGEWWGWVIYEYDSTGNLIAETYYKVGSGISGHYEYDSAGNMVIIALYNNDGSRRYYGVNEYDSTGRVTKYTEYDANDKIEHSTICTYDAGNNLKETVYNAAGELYVIREFDGPDGGHEGNLIKYTHYQKDGSYTVIEYDSDGNIKKSTSYDADGTVKE